jgi:hypothetical protein
MARKIVSDDFGMLKVVVNFFSLRGDLGVEMSAVGSLVHALRMKPT